MQQCQIFMAQFSKIDQLYQYNKTLNILKPRDQKWSSKYEESLYKSYVNHLFSIKFSLIDSIECTVFLLYRANMWMFTKVMYSIGIPNILPSYFRTWLHRLLIIVFLVTYRLNICCYILAKVTIFSNEDLLYNHSWFWV